MKIIILLSTVCLFSSAGFSQAAYSPETLERIKEVENAISGRLMLNDEKPGTIAERMAKYHVKGLSMAIIRDYKIDWAKGYGWADEAEKRPVTTETLFEPGSISKSLNAVGILKLAQDKKVDLYTDINTYLTSWKFPYDSLSKGKKITLAHILSHSAGLSVHGFPGHDLKGRIPSVYDILDGKKNSFTPPVRSQFEPGLRFQYSGGGTSISQVVLTDVTKQPYDVWMYENVLKPIGMVSSTYAQPPSKEKWALCASAYNGDGTPIKNKFHVYPEQAAAGLWMTPSDLCRYIIDMQVAYKGGESKVLTKEMVKLHLTPYGKGDAALGTFIEDHNGALYFQHGAGNDGFCGMFFGSLDDGYGIAIFMNTDDPTLFGELINQVAKVYHWKNFYQEPKLRKTIQVPGEILKSYEGIYLYDNSWAGIGKSDSNYYYTVQNTAAKMYFTSATAFFNEEFPAEKEFIKDEQGNISGYTRTVNGKSYPNAIRVRNPDTLKLAGSEFGNMTWYLFEAKQYEEALRYCKRGLQLYPGDVGLLSKMGHIYLYSNDTRQAIVIYKQLMGNFKSKAEWEAMMREVLIYFKNNKYDVRAFDQVFAELNIKKPKGY